jgi:plastocyanin
VQESRRHFVAALAAGVTGTLAGCGGSEDSPTETASETQTETPSQPMPETETDMPEPSETDAPTGTESTAEFTFSPPDEVAEVVGVAGDGLRFSPASFTISAGDTVRWEWNGGGHNVKPETTPSGSDWSGTPGDATNTFASGYSYSYTFDTPGRYTYYCSPHRSVGMTGSFTVTE